MAECNIQQIAKHTVDPIRRLYDYANIAPWVKLWFVGDGSEDKPKITVGNESCPGCTPTHSAVIKSFEYGFMDGSQCKIEILDVQGGSMADIARHLFKCIEKAETDYFMKVKWGWVGTNCRSPGADNVWSSPTQTFLPMNIEIHYSKAAIRYTLTGVDLLQAVFNSRKTTSYGTEKHRLKLKEALEKMYKHEQPSIQFLRGRRKGKTMLYGDAAYIWKDIDEHDGSKWNSDGQNKNGTAVKWTENFRTNHDKGTIPFWKTGANGPAIVFLEAGGQDCVKNPGEMLARSVGTFIVNGGKCSNVLDFKPQINWVAAFAQLMSGGQPGTPLNGKQFKRKNERPAGCKVQNPKTGPNTSIQHTDPAWDAYGKQLTEKSMKATDANEKAANISGLVHPVEAELRIQGNPSPEFCVFQDAVARTCAIVALNPFHLDTSWGGEKACPDWLASPFVNDILTNRFWWIMGVNHSIKEGSYVTTLKVRLDTPGIDLSAKEEPGGDPNAPTYSGPYWTKKTC